MLIIALTVTACGSAHSAPRPDSTDATPTPPPALQSAMATTSPTAAVTVAPNDAPPADLVAAGRELFTGGGGCSACHTIEGIAQGILGPDQSRIGALAASRIPGYTAEQYIRESIVDPCAYRVTTADQDIRQDYDCNLMLATMAGIRLSGADVDALVAFLLEQL